MTMVPSAQKPSSQTSQRPHGSGQQEFGHHGVVDGQRAATAIPVRKRSATSMVKSVAKTDARPKTASQAAVRSRTLRRPIRSAMRPNRVAPANMPRRTASRSGAPALVRAETGRDPGGGEADGDDLHRIRRPDQPERCPEAGAGTNPRPCASASSMVICMACPSRRNHWRHLPIPRQEFPARTRTSPAPAPAPGDGGRGAGRSGSRAGCWPEGPKAAPSFEARSSDGSGSAAGAAASSPLSSSGAGAAGSSAGCRKMSCAPRVLPGRMMPGGNGQDLLVDFRDHAHPAVDVRQHRPQFPVLPRGRDAAQGRRGRD